MQTIRAVATQPTIIDNWFEQLAIAYNEHNLGDKSFQIFNCDESVCNLIKAKSKLFLEKEQKTLKS